MPIAKLRSADGDIDIYYELHGATQTARDDFCYSKAASLREKQGPNSLDRASAVDPALQRVKDAVDDATVAGAAADAGREVLEGQRLRGASPRPIIEPGSLPAAGQGAGGSSLGCEQELVGDVAAGAPLLRPAAHTNGVNRTHAEVRMPHERSAGGAGAYVGAVPGCPGAAGTVAAAGAEEQQRQPCGNVLFICGMSARGRTEFFHPIVAHLAALRGAGGRPLLTCCTFDNRGIGNSSIPEHYGAYRTGLMAADALALMDHLGWRRAHILGMSLGGMIGCKLLASMPSRVASLTMLSTTIAGWNMALTMLRRPWITLRAGQGPLRSRIPANLRANFSPRYLAQRVDGGRTRAEVLAESTWEAIRLGLTEKFLAEGQPDIGRNGHVLAVLTHSLSKREVGAMRASGAALQMINGCHDLVAGLGYVQALARRLRCPLILTEGAHAGICLETPGPIIAAMERIIDVQKLQKMAADEVMKPPVE